MNQAHACDLRVHSSSSDGWSKKGGMTTDEARVHQANLPKRRRDLSSVLEAAWRPTFDQLSPCETQCCPSALETVLPKSCPFVPDDDFSHEFARLLRDKHQERKKLVEQGVNDKSLLPIPVLAERVAVQLCFFDGPSAPSMTNGDGNHTIGTMSGYGTARSKGLKSCLKQPFAPQVPKRLTYNKIFEDVHPIPLRQD